jgi:diguanylate cyclase (GGDEF)-like protein/PAS domain S-box-containing protein
MSEPDPQLKRVLAATSTQVGDYFQRVSAFERLRESEERLSSTMALAAIGIAHVDSGGRFIYANPQLCEMLQYEERELLGLTVKEISHPSDVNATDELRDRLRAGGIKSFKIEKRYLRKDGSPIWVCLTIAKKRDRFGNELYDVSVVEDISARKAVEERVQHLATHDGLTGLPNRVMFVELLNHEIETARRHNRKLAVLFIDLDRFKVINDTLGHDAGDVLLQEMADRLKQNLRPSDVVARLGGDEFVVLVPEVTEMSQVTQVARNVLSTAMKPVLILGRECRVTASVGICVFPDGASDQQTVMKNADMAMYAAKEEGKNNYQVYSGDLRVHSVERLTLETNLRRALERNELFIHYQAKVNFATGMITGVEALLRWENPELGLVSPATFIPLAEEMGLIVPIGLWVLQTACAQDVAWQREGLPPVCMSVNLSLRQLNDEHLVEEIAAVLKETGLDPQLLELEITESMVMHDSDKAVRLLTRIKELGVRLAIDDFGTGYSSLAQLKRFPIDTLKVDRSFIREVARDPDDRAITEAIIAMGKTLSLTIVAEGVETPEQQAFLAERSCDEMQGYYFSVPIAPSDFAALLRKHRPAPRR